MFYTRHFYLYLLLLSIPFYSHAQEWNNYTPDNSPIKSITDIKDIAVDPVSQDVWIAAGTMIYQRKSNGTWTSIELSTTPGLSLAASTCISARNGIVWTGQAITNELTDKLSYFNGTTWQTITLPTTYYFIADIEIAASFVWVACSAGLYQYDGTTWKKLDYQSKINQPTSISWNESTRKLWVSNNCVGAGNAYRYDLDTNSWTEFTLTYNCAHAVQTLPDGNAYIGSCNASGVTSIKNGQVSAPIATSCFAIDGMALNPLSAAEVWLGTEYNYSQPVPFGLALYDGNSIVKSFNFRNSAMKGGSLETMAVQKVDDATAVVWMKTQQSYDANYPQGSFLETYTYTAAGNSLTSFQFQQPQVTAIITGNEITAWAPLNTDLSALKAVFTVSDGATVKVGNVVQVSGVTPNDFRSPVTYTVVSSSGQTRNYAVTITIAGNSFLSFSIHEPTTVGNIQNNEITLTLPSTTDLSHLISEFTTSPGAMVKVNDVLQHSGSTTNDFTNSVMYSVVSAYGEIKNYRASVTIITGITNKDSDPDLKIFPIPATDHFIIRAAKTLDEPLKLTLYSVLGEVIESREMYPGQEETVFDTGHTKGNLVILRCNNQAYKITLLH